jgi:hypothetical protein
MTIKRKQREINKQIILKGKIRQIGAADLFALIAAFTQAAQNPKIGFNHVSTDITGWLASFAPWGLVMDDAFLEDLLYGANMLDELGQFKHPLEKDFDGMLAGILRPGEVFDKVTNSIREKEEDGN